MRFQVYRQYLVKRHRAKVVRGLRLNMNEYGPWQTEEVLEATHTLEAFEKAATKKDGSVLTMVDPIPEVKNDRETGTR